MSLARSVQLPIRKSRSNLWFERFMAILILFNYLLVLFDLSYIPYRDFWQQGKFQISIHTPIFKANFPEQPIKILNLRVTDGYDWVKGIEPNLETVQYLVKVEQLNNNINEKALQLSPSQTDPIAAEKIDLILAELQNLSDEMIAVNPFDIANKTGTLETIKNRMRQHIFDTEEASAYQAFNIFWSRDNLSENGFREELDFFNRDIKPLIQTNYYRSIGENGKPSDNFIIVDFPFTAFFLIEFLVKTLLISRRFTGVSWFDAMLWRWYDIFLFLPVFRWLRLIPLVIRLNQAKLLDLKAIQRQISQGFVAGIAEDVTEVVVVKVINQIQKSIHQGEIQNFLTQRHRGQIDLNGTDEIAEIIKIIVQVTVHGVIPKIQPEAENLLRYSIAKALAQTPIYQNLQQVPGMKNLENQFGKIMAAQLYRAFCETLTPMTKTDPKFNELWGQLSTHFSQTLGSELQSQYRIDRIEKLSIDFLEEFKINYVKRLSAEDIEMILEQTRAMRRPSQDITLLETSSMHRFP